MLIRPGLRRGAKRGFFARGASYNMALTTIAALLASGVTNSVATTNPPGTVTLSDGTVGYGAHNLLLNSAGAASGGALYGTSAISGTVTVDGVGPDGATTANKFTASAGGAYWELTSGTLASGTRTVTMGAWVKASGSAIGKGTTVYLIRDAYAASANTAGPTLTGAWQWVTFSNTFAANATTVNARIDINSVAAGDAITIAQQQVCYGGTLTLFVPTTTAPVYAPRLTCDRGATHNLLAWSEDLTQAGGWAKQAISSATAYGLIEDATNNAHLAYQNVSLARSTAYRANAIVQAAGRTWASMYLSDGVTGSYQTFDLANCKVGTTSANVTSGSACITALGGGRYWISFGITSGSTGSGGQIQVRPSNADAFATYVGDGVSGINMLGGWVTRGANLLPYLRTFDTAPLYASGTPTGQNLETTSTAAPGLNSAGWGTGTPGNVSGTTVSPVAAGASGRTTRFVSSGGGPNEIASITKGCTYTLGVILTGSGTVNVASYNGSAFDYGRSYTLSATPQVCYTRVTPSNSSGSGNGGDNRLVITNEAIGGASAGNATSYTILGVFAYEGDADLPYAATTGTPVSVYPQKSMKREPQRTNSVLQCRDYTNAAWVKNGGMTVTANSTQSLLGATDACLLTPVNTVVCYLQQNISVSASTTRTVSAFIKAGSSAASRLSVWNGAVSAIVASVTIGWSGGVPSTSGTLGTWSTAPVLEAWGGGWWRVKGTYSTGANTSIAVLYYPDNSNGTGTGYLDLVQDELGGWATTPIITGASAVTRDADLIRPAAGFITDGPQTIRVRFAPDKAASGATQALVQRGSTGLPLYLGASGIPTVWDGTAVVASGSAADGVAITSVVSWSGASMKVSSAGVAVTSGAFDGTMGIGSASAWGDDGSGTSGFSGDILCIESVAAFATDAQMPQLSAGTLQ